MRTVYFFLLTILLSCSDSVGEMEVGKKYTVTQGHHDYDPSPLPLPQKAKSVSGSAVFHASCWYDNLGADQSDWNKLCGFYQFSDIIKNKNAFMLAWRPDIKIRDVFELCVYENIDGRNWAKEWSIYKVRQGELFYFDFVLINGKYNLYINGILLEKQTNDLNYKTVGKISAWFGGNRKAPQTMWLWLDF